MNHFPLPNGICREVCRPFRTRNRVVKLGDVVRFAKAAVKHGADRCEVAGAVAKAVECDKCRKEQAALGRASIDYVYQLGLLEDAIRDLRDALGFPDERNSPTRVPKDWLESLTSRFKRLFGWLNILIILARIIDASEGVIQESHTLLRAQEDLLQCLGNVE